MNQDKTVNESMQYPLYRWLMLAAAIMTMYCAMLICISFAPLMGVIAKDLGIDVGTASFGFMGMNLFSTAFGVIIAGFLVDKIGLPRVMIGGLVLMLAANSSLPLIGHSYGGVVFIRIIEALGAAPALIAIEPTVSYWFPDKEKGIALGLNGLSVLGAVSAGMFGPGLVAAAGGNWQNGLFRFSFVLFAVIVLVTAICIGAKNYTTPAMKREHSEDLVAKAVSKSDFVTVVLRNPVFWLGLCVMAFSNWANQAFNDLSPGYMAVDKPIGLGFGPGASGRFSAGTWIGMVAGMFAAGFIIDKVFKGKSAPLVMIGFIGNIIFYNGILVYSIYSSAPVLTMWLMCAGFVNPFTAIGNQYFAVRTFAPNVIGKVAASWTCVSNFIGALGVMVGSYALHSTGNYHMSFAIVSVVSIIGFIAALVSRERRTVIESQGRGINI